MAEFVTNRTQAHVALLKRLRTKHYINMSSSERELWLSEAAKGAYNYTDLNRVESAVAEIAELMGLTLTTKTDWTASDIPDATSMGRYIDNVVTIRNSCPNGGEFPTLPSSMYRLTYEQANNIEKVLYLAYRYAGGTVVENDNVLGKCVLGKMKLGST